MWLKVIIALGSIFDFASKIWDSIKSSKAAKKQEDLRDSAEGVKDAETAEDVRKANRDLNKSINP